MAALRSWLFLVLPALLLLGCGDDTSDGSDVDPGGDGGAIDGGATDGGQDDGGAPSDGALPVDLGDTDMGTPPSSVAQVAVLLEAELDVGSDNELAFDPAGEQLFAGSAGDDNRWNIFEVDSDGALRLVQKFGIFIGDTPRHIALTDSFGWAVHGQWLVTLDREGGRVREVPDSRLQLPSFSVRELVVDDSGSHLYALYEDGGWGIRLFTLDADGVPTVTDSYDASTVTEVSAGADLVDAALAPDGAQLYAIGDAGNTLVSFERNTGTGALTYDSALTVSEPLELVVSGDGAHVYALTPSDVVRFDRNATTGALTEIDAATTGVDGRWLTIAPDGQDLYVGSAIAPGTAGSIVRLGRDADSASATFGALSVEETTDLSVSQWIADGAVAPDGTGVFALTGSPDSAEDVQGSVARFERATDGTLGAETRFEDRAPQSLTWGAGVAVHPNGEWLYATGALGTETAGSARVLGIARVGWDGSLVPGGYHTCLDDTDRACEVWDLAFSADGTLAVGTGREGIFGALFFYDVDADTGELTAPTVLDGQANSLFDFDEILDLALVQDGGSTLVYVVDEDALSVASRPSDIDPFFFAQLQEGDDPKVAGSRGIAATSDGAFLYMVNGESVVTVDTERLMAITTRTSAIVQRIGADAAGVSGLDGAQRVVVSPDDAYVYVVSDADASIAIFERSSADGMLTFQESLANGLGGVGESFATAGDTLAQDYDLTITPDGSWVVASVDLRMNEPTDQDGVAVFRRDASTGSLTLVRTFRQGEMGASGMAGASGIAVHPTSAFAFSSASYSGGVAAFSLGE